MRTDGIDSVCRSVSVAWNPQRIRFLALQLLYTCVMLCLKCATRVVFKQTYAVTVRLIHVAANLTLHYGNWLGQIELANSATATASSHIPHHCKQGSRQGGCNVRCSTHAQLAPPTASIECSATCHSLSQCRTIRSQLSRSRSFGNTNPSVSREHQASSRELGMHAQQAINLTGCYNEQIHN
jgi:hypothetical protein